MKALLLTGAPGVGKSTVARRVAERLPLSAHVEADVLHRMIVSGGEWPSSGTPEAFTQLLLRTGNVALLGKRFLDAGIVPILDEVVASDDQLQLVHEAIPPDRLITVILTAPTDVLLQRDAGRSKQTAANYVGVADMVAATVGPIADGIETAGMTVEETADEVIAKITDER